MSDKVTNLSPIRNGEAKCLPANQDWQGHSIERQPQLSQTVIASVVVAVALVVPAAGLAAVVALAEPVAALAANSSIGSMQLVVKTFVAMQTAVETVTICETGE